MRLHEHDQKNIDRFWSAVAPFEAAYRHSSFSYFALKEGDKFILKHARIFLQTDPPQFPSNQFQSANIRVGHFSLEQLQICPNTLFESALTGSLPIPDGELIFPPEDDGKYRTAFVPFHQEGLQTQRRWNFLTLVGAREKLPPDQKQIDWELKAALTPYETLQELLTEYGLGFHQSDCVEIEVIAFGVAIINPQLSEISETKANVAINLANGLDTKNVCLGYRELNNGRVEARSMVQSAEMQWNSQDSHQIGRARIDIKKGSILQCFASYSGIAQHQWYLTNPSTAQNPRRAVYMAFDNNLATLQEFLSKPDGNRRNAYDFEFGISWLLWLLGFSIAHLGATGKTQDAPDIIATTPNGHCAVVECTTGLLKAENKLPNLIDRTEAVRRSLESSGNSYLRVIPVMVTSKSRDEVSADLEQAEKLGILVITRENLIDIDMHTFFQRDADKLYQDAEREIQAALAKHANKLSGGGESI